MDKEKVLNLGLLFPKPLSQQLETYSKELAKFLPGPSTLGDNSLAHISIVQFLSTKSTELIWQEMQAKKISPPKIEFSGLYFEKSKTSGKLYFGIRIALTQDLIDFQQELIEIAKPDPIINGVGAEFFPHITLGCNLEAAETLPSLPFHSDLTLLKNVSTILALGRSGPNLQFKEIVYSC